MEAFEVKINTSFPAQITKTYLADLFNPNSENDNKLKYEIQREYRFSGSPEVTSIKFDSVTYEPATGKGSFRVILDINFTFGCEDVQADKHNQSSDWTFEVDQQLSIIRFYSSPYAEARSTADEF